MLNQRLTYFPLPNGGKFLYEVLTYDFNVWGAKFMSKMTKRAPKKNTCSLSSAEKAVLEREEALFLEQYAATAARALGADSRERAFRRAKKRVFELICSNSDLQMFCTFTLQFDRDDYEAIIKRLGQWLDNRVRRKGLRYILVAEYCDDERSIHFHGVFNEGALKMENSGHKRGRKVIYNLPEWELGFASAVRIGAKNEDWQRTARHITDYMLKNNFGRVGGRFYLHGGHLEEPVYEYLSRDYESADGEEITVGGKVSFKLKRFL